MKTIVDAVPIPRISLLFGGLLFLCFLIYLPLSTAAADLAAPPAQAGCTFDAADEATLRSAIDGINQASGGVCTLRITGYTIELTQPLPPITNANLDELVIDGQQHTIWARRTGRVLAVQSVNQLTMHDLTLYGGLVPDSGHGIDDWGGGLRLYCGEDRECAATLTRVSLFGSQAVEGGGLGIYCASGSRCSTRLVDSALLANEAVAGGAITTGFDEANLAFSLELLRTTVWSNRAVEGGGIRLRGADFTAVDSTIRSNSATAGGGIAMIASSYILRANILRSSIFDNEATQRGGGFYIRSADPGDVQVTLANSTVSGNRVTDATGIGGGLAMSATYGLQVDLLNTTVANNQAATGAGIYLALEDDSFAPATLLTLANSLVADNQGGSACTTLLEQPPVKGVPLLTSRGHNLDSDGSCLPPAVRQASDFPSANADLAPLTDNRGQTWTHALRLGSAALDAGDDVLCAADPISGVDQRGDSRSQGLHCDIGAYERANAPQCTYPALTVGDEAALHQAITCVNLAGPGAYTITVAADISYTQPISSIRNPVIDNLLIDGQGHTLDAQGHGSVLRLDETNLAVRDLTLRGGRLPTVNDGVTPNLGGGIYAIAPWNGFATEPSCTLRLERVTITDNEAYAGGGLYYGCEQPLTIIDSTVSNNRAIMGGAFSTAGGEEFFTEVFVQGSTFNHNEAQSSGGAFDMSIGDGGVRLHLVNSTVSSNRVISGAGGGIWITQSSIDGISETALTNSTVANNAANEGSGVYNRYGSLVMTNTIIADNGGGANCILFVSDDGNGRLVSNGNNLDSDGTCLPDGVRQPSDLPNGNANLGPLADNGGPTLTHQPLTGSQAIDAGNDGVCTAAPVNGVDQRGAARPQGAHCEIGAVETGDGQSMVYTVTKFTDSNDGLCDADCSLREAVDAANRHFGRDEIHLASGVYSLTIPGLVDDEGETIDDDDNARGDLDITDDLWLTGQGADATTIAGNGAQYVFGGGADRIFEVRVGATVTVEGLTVRYGRVSDVGGGLSNHGRLTLNGVHVVDNQAASGFKIGHGGGIFNDGELIITDSQIASNRAGGGEASYGEGGGIRNDGQLTLRNSVIADNSTWDDNDTGFGGGLRNAGTAVLEDCMISNNSTSVSGEGGGIYNVGNLTLTGCTVTQNQALKGAGVADRGTIVSVATSFLTNNATFAESGGEGGAIYAAGGPMTITHSTIADNYGASTGGGIVHNSASPMTIIASTLARNRTDNAGGAIFNNLVGDVQALDIINTTIYSNAAAVAGGIAIDGGPVTLLNSTVAGNRATTAGGGLGYSEGGRLINTILAGNTAPSGPDCSVRVDSLGNNLIGDPTGCTVTLPPTDRVGDPQLAAFVEDSAAGGGYLPLQPTSPAIDAGDDAICTSNPVNGVDQRGTLRPQGAHCDIGAYEAGVQTTDNLLFVSSRSSGTAGDFAFRDEDIVAYDFNTASWRMIFDGSDVGVTKDVDAFAFHAGGLLLSFNGPTVVPNLGDVDDSDLVLFTPDRLGNDTSGNFALYLRGADVGLTTDSEDVDLIDFSPEGHLVVSTIGDFATATVSGQDEDLIELTDAASGAWLLFLDGAAIGLANEDINGLWIDPANGDRYLTVKDSFAFDNVQIDADDIFVCTPNGPGGCTYRLFWDSDQHNYGAENLDAIDMGVLPFTFAAGLPADISALTPTEIAEDNEQDDLEGDALNSKLYLPMIRQ